MSLMSWVVSSSVVPALGPLGDQEVPQPLLADHVQADGRLVQHQQPRAVHQGGRHLAAHPLPQRQLAYGGVELLGDAEPVDQLRIACGRRRPRVEPVDGGQDPERVPQRQIPPELAALAEHHPDLAGQHPTCGTGSRPQVRTCPEVGTRMPVIILMVVDLPAPLAPM